MRVAVLSRDLILASRIMGQAAAAGHEAQLVADPAALPIASAVDLLFVNWADRESSWADELAGWRHGATSPGPRVLLYGPHTDLRAHAASRAAGLGPMCSRSKLISDLPNLLSALD